MHFLNLKTPVPEEVPGVVVDVEEVDAEEVEAAVEVVVPLPVVR